MFKNFFVTPPAASGGSASGPPGDGASHLHEQGKNPTMADRLVLELPMEEEDNQVSRIAQMQALDGEHVR